MNVLPFKFKLGTRGWRDVDPEHWVGRGGVRPEAEKKIVHLVFFVTNCITEQFIMGSAVVHALQLSSYLFVCL